ncbi:hypothetical protein ABH944_002978 [Caballeronia udeis]|uniref:Uncharacterized protein n=1 Tax=Caballeronia udeis TaxID=1232866 RepID=A0ABW8MGR8_9BURK
MAQTAKRRADRGRLRHNRLYWWGRKLCDGRELGAVIDTPTPCSCWMCGNPRRHLKKDRLSIWEQRWFQEIGDENSGPSYGSPSSRRAGAPDGC